MTSPAKTRTPHIVLAPGGFKGRLRGTEVADALGRGLQAAFPRAHVVRRPMADGGAGTAEAIAAAKGGEWFTLPTVDAYGRARTADVLCAPDGTWGLEAVMGPRWEPPERRGDAATASARGLGLLMAHARDAGAGRIVVGVGDTGSSDGGLGLVETLGGSVTPSGVVGLAGLAAVRAVSLPSWTLPTEVWCDVTAPLTGPGGAIWGFGVQKGVDPGALAHEDAVMARWGALLEKAAGQSLVKRPGAGAGGGLGVMLAALGGQLERGAERVAQMVELEAAMRGADLVVTGEGRVDATTTAGKTVAVVAALAHRHAVPVVVVAAEVDPRVVGGPLGAAVLSLDPASGASLVEQLEAVAPRLKAFLD